MQKSQLYKPIFFQYGFLLATCILLLLSCENTDAEIKAFTKKNLGVEEGKNIESLLSNGGKLKAKLTAPIMLRYQYDSAMIEFPKTLHVIFYDSLTKVESILDAKYGRYLENTNKVFLKDSVRVFNVKGDTLWCNELYWDQAQQTFFTDKPVTIKQGNQQKIDGKEGLLADQNFKWFTLNKVGRNYTGKENFINIPDSTY